MVWIVEFTSGVEYARFFFFSHTYMVHKKNPLTSCLSYVSRLDCWNVVKVMKQQCNVTTTSPIEELEQRFPAQDIMNAIGVIYP